MGGFWGVSLSISRTFTLESLQLVYKRARALAPLMRVLIRVRARYGE